MDEQFEKRGYLLEDFRLFHLQDARGVKTEYHYHEFCKLLLLLSGSGSYTVEGRQYPLGPGDVVMLGSHCVHRSAFEPGRPYERMILYISPDFLQRHSTPQTQLEDCFSGIHGHVMHLSDKHLQRLTFLASALEQELSGTRFAGAIASTGLLLQLLAEVVRFQQDRSALWTAPAIPSSPLIRSLLSYLDQNLEQELSIDDLAEHFFTSKFHMMRQFRQETGTTIHSYVTEKRLFLARNMIQQGISSTEACFRAGFGSYSSFTRSYAKLFGMTPTGRSIQQKTDDLKE